MSAGYARTTDKGSLLNVRVSTGARETAIAGTYGEEALGIKVSAPPVGRRANAELERFLSRRLGLPRSSASVVRGASSRDKVVFVRNAQPEELRKSLASPAR